MGEQRSPRSPFSSGGTMRCLCAFLVVFPLVASAVDITGQDAVDLIAGLENAIETSTEQLGIIVEKKGIAETKNAEKVALEAEVASLQNAIASLANSIDVIDNAYLAPLDQGGRGMASAMFDSIQLGRDALAEDRDAKAELEKTVTAKTTLAQEAAREATEASNAATAAEQALNRCTIVLGSTPTIVRLSTVATASSNNAGGALSQSPRDEGFCVMDSDGTVPTSETAHLYCASSLVPPASHAATPAGMDPINVRACKTADNGVIVVKHFQGQSISFREDTGAAVSLCVDYIKVSACAPITAKNKGNNGCTSSSPCSRGEGDCDNNSQCAGSLQCKHRSNYEAVPGVDTSGLTGSDHQVKTFDFCYDPAADGQQLDCVAKKVVYRCKTSCDTDASDCSPEQAYAAGMNV